jgi:hypothetical protein
MKYCYEILSPKDLDAEVWKSLPNYEGRYDWSNMGRVRSLVKANSGGGVSKRKIPLIRKQRINADGYLQVGLQSNGELKTFIVHRWVGILFVPNPENLPEVNHLKGKLDCRSASLEWTTASDNQKHAYKNGLRIPLGGEKNPKCILTEKEVLEIFNSSKHKNELAVMYKISTHTIRHIKRGSTWSYLTGKTYKRKCEQP